MSDAFYRSGHITDPEHKGVINELPHLLHQQGIRNVQSRVVSIDYRTGTHTMDIFLEDTKLAVRTVLPFIHKWSHVPDNYEVLCQQAFVDMQQPGFVVTLNLITAWGTSIYSKKISALV